MRFKTKIIMLVTIMVLIMAAFCPPGRADTVADNQGQVAEGITQVWVNPYYVDNDTNLQFVKPQQALEVLTPSYVANLDELKTLLRQAFAKRETSIPIIYTGASNDLQQIESIINSIKAEDDYLQFSMQGWSFNGQGTEGNYQINLAVGYLTTLEQENDVDRRVAEILSTIIDPGMNPHQIVKAIHDYIVLNVAYDQTLTEHSAYAALFNKHQTVCQGYALLAYKMLEQAGLQARIIGGTAGGGSHAWNMVQLEDQWYYMDCTWDDPVPDIAGRVKYNYYNLSAQEINIDHQADAEYSSLPLAGTPYADTLNTLIQANSNQNEIYLRLRQQLELDYLLPENTAATADDLKIKMLAGAAQYNSEYGVRYNNGSGNLGSTVNQIFYEIASQTKLIGYSLSYTDYNRGGTDGYLLLNFVFTYSLSNCAPTASSVTIEGTPRTNEKIMGTYQYNDVENNLEGLSQLQWYRGEKDDGSDKSVIPGAIGHCYTVHSVDEGKYLFFEVCPIASTGTLSGTSAWSSASSKVESATVTLESLEITTPAAKRSYTVGDTLDITGLVVTGAYSDGSTKPEPITAANITGFNSATAAAEQVLTITIGDKTVTYKVQITAAQPVDECFIATAAFGSKFTWPVALLRHFRDQYLLATSWGTAFVEFYYQHSPPIAAMIATSQSLKMLVGVLLAPVIAIVYIMYHPMLMVIVLLGVFLIYRYRLRKRYVRV